MYRTVKSFFITTVFFRPVQDAITSWIKENYHGLVGHRTLDNAQDFKEPLVIAFFDVDYVKNVKGTNYWRNRIMKVAKAQSKLSFAISNKDDFMQVRLETSNAVEMLHFSNFHAGGQRIRA